MYDNTEQYKDLISSWQRAYDRRDAHAAYRRLVDNSKYSYSTYMDQIRYLKREKGIRLKELDLPQTDWEELKEFAIDELLDFNAGVAQG